MFEEARFGDLRALMQAPWVDDTWASRLWDLLDTTHAEHPDTYRQTWLPYLEGFDVWSRGPIHTVHSLKKLRQSLEFAPFALYEMCVRDLSNPVDPEVLLRAPELTCVHTLSLGPTPTPALDALMRSEHLGAMRVLEFHNQSLWNPGVITLSTWERLGQLEALDLHSTYHNDEGLRALLGSPHIRGLRRLDLGQNLVSERARGPRHVPGHRPQPSLQPVDAARGARARRVVA